MTDSMRAVSDICATITKKVDRAYVAECGIKGEIPEKLWRMWADTGLLGMGIPEEYGGSGGGVSEIVLANDLLHQAGLEMHAAPNQMSRTTIVKHGTAAQKQKYLPPTVSGKTVFAFSITEPDAGTNTFKIRTNAKRRGGAYILNGQKHFCTGFRESDFVLVVTRTAAADPANRTSGLSLFVVDTKAKGLSSTEMNVAIYFPGKHYVVNFDDVEVPAENLIGPEGRGLEAMFDCLNSERLITAGKAVGMADHVLGRAVEYAKIRAPFDTPIGAYQSIQHPMAAAKAKIEAARLMIYAAAALYDRGGKAGLAANRVKYLSSDAFKAAADIAATTFGGAALDLDNDIIPFYLRAKLQEVAPVNNLAVLGFIGQQELGLPKSY